MTVLALGSIAHAAELDYMRIKPNIGLGIEVKGALSDRGGFEVKHIEVLEEPRSPRLRGSVQAIDRTGQRLRLFGRWISVNQHTQNANPNKPFDFAALRNGDQIEVKCKVDDRGDWYARRVATENVKPSDKIKGTITDFAVDGVAPDTLNVSGLLLILTARTSVTLLGDLPSSPIIEDLLHDASYVDSRGLDRPGSHLFQNRLFVGLQFRQNMRLEREFDLSKTSDSDRDEMQPELRFEARAFLSPSIQTYAQARVRRKIVLEDQLDGSLFSSSPDEGVEADVLQLNVIWRQRAVDGFALQLGRQDIEDPREWLFDDYLDAARAYFYSGNHFSVEAAWLHPVRPIKDKIREWDDVYLMAQYYFEKHSAATVYFLARDDTSQRERQPIWFGARYRGRHSGFRPWVDLARMAGVDKGLGLDAWAADVGVTYLDESVKWMPSATIGFAVGSGDDDGGPRSKDGTFRQTGYQDNAARLGGVSSVLYYGALLDPELSNLQVWTLGAAIRPMKDSSVEVILHTYRQHHAGIRLRGTNLRDSFENPNGASGDLGWEFDAVVTIPPVWRGIRAKWTFGYFNPGAGFFPQQETAFLNKFDFNVRF